MKQPLKLFAAAGVLGAGLLLAAPTTARAHDNDHGEAHDQHKQGHHGRHDRRPWAFLFGLHAHVYPAYGPWHAGPCPMDAPHGPHSGALDSHSPRGGLYLGW